MPVGVRRAGLWMSCLSRGIAVLNVNTSPVGITQLPKTLPVLFLTNYPNPFTSRTSLCFTLVNEGPISLIIYDINGKIVRDFPRTYYNSGTSFIEWDRHDNQGNKVLPGIYTCQINQGNDSKSILIIVQ